MTGRTLSFPFVNSMFLVENYFPLIQRFIDDSLFFELNADETKKANFYIQNSEADTSDSILSFGAPLTTNFANIANIKSYDGSYNLNYLSAVYIRYDSQFDTYTRTVYGVLDWLSAIGGLAGSLMAGIGAIVSYFANRMFISKIVSKVY